MPSYNFNLEVQIGTNGFTEIKMVAATSRLWSSAQVTHYTIINREKDWELGFTFGNPELISSRSDQRTTISVNQLSSVMLSFKIGAVEIMAAKLTG